MNSNSFPICHSFQPAVRPREQPSNSDPTVSASYLPSVSRPNNSNPPKSPSSERSRPSRVPNAGCESFLTCPSVSRETRRGWERERERSSIGLVGCPMERSCSRSEAVGSGKRSLKRVSKASGVFFGRCSRKCPAHAVSCLLPTLISSSTSLC